MNGMWMMTLGALLAAASAPAEAEWQPRLEAKQGKDQIEVYVNGELFTAYKYGADQKYPYFYPVNGPLSGESVTTESSEPYPHHHSLFFGCDRVNGGNYWQDHNRRGQILSQGPAFKTEGDSVVVTDTCLWKRPGHDPVIRGTRRFVIRAPKADLRIIDAVLKLEPLEDVRIEKTNHSLFSARMRPELSVNSGGALVNASGGQREEGTFGQPAPWCDYSGQRDGHTEGLAILQHPGNPWYPAKWFTRDYGFFSPTPMYWPADDEATRLPKGEPVVLRYRVLVHGGDAASAGIGDLFEAYRAEASAE